VSCKTPAAWLALSAQLLFTSATTHRTVDVVGYLEYDLAGGQSGDVGKPHRITDDARKITG
jgi:hypothetical protein